MPLTLQSMATMYTTPVRTPAVLAPALTSSLPKKGAAMTLTAMWFPWKQGQAMSIVAMGSNLASMLFVPLLTVMTAAMGIAKHLPNLRHSGRGRAGPAPAAEHPRRTGPLPRQRLTEAECKANYAAVPPEIDAGSGWTTGKLLKTKEVWLCVFATGFLMLAQMGIMSQLVARNMEVGMDRAMATGVMSALAVVGVGGARQANEEEGNVPGPLHMLPDFRNVLERVLKQTLARRRQGQLVCPSGGGGAL